MSTGGRTQNRSLRYKRLERRAHWVSGERLKARYLFLLMHEIKIIKPPSHLATLEGSGSGVERASNMSSSTVELVDMLSTPKEKSNVSNQIYDSTTIKLLEGIPNVEHTETEADRAENRYPNGNPVSPVSAPMLRVMGLIGEHLALQANQSQATYDTVIPSTANSVHDLNLADNAIDDFRH